MAKPCPELELTLQIARQRSKVVQHILLASVTLALLSVPSRAEAQSPNLEMPPMHLMPPSPEACRVLDDGTLEPGTCLLEPGAWLLPPETADNINLYLTQCELYPEVAKEALAQNDTVWRTVIRGLAKIHHAEQLVTKVTPSGPVSVDSGFSFWWLAAGAVLSAVSFAVGVFLGAYYGG